MRINTNIGALTAASNLARVNQSVKDSTEKLSSGFRINKAADDAAGLGVANLFRSDVRALTQAQRNAEQATSVFQIAEGGATGIQKILERMKELAAQAAADAVDSAGRARIDLEFQSLINEIDRVTTTTEFQGSKLLDGTYGASVNAAGIPAATAGTVTTDGVARAVTLTAGGAWITATSGNIVQSAAWAVSTKINLASVGLTINVGTGVVGDFVKNITTTAGSGSFLIGAARNAQASYVGTTSNVLTISGSALSLTTTSLSVANTSTTSLATSQTALSAVDSALALVNTALGVIGAGQNRLSSAIDNVKSTILNYQAAESAIRDLDMADEMVKFSKNQIISQAAVAMLAQANQVGQGVLTLIRGG